MSQPAEIKVNPEVASTADWSTKSTSKANRSDEQPTDGCDLPTPGVATLPPHLRARVIALASRGISQLPATRIPPALRASASFAPAKREKLVGGQIAATLDSDDEFREHLATQVRALVPKALAALELGAAETVPSPDDAAAAFLVRPGGWVAVVERAIRAEQQRRVTAGGDPVATVERLRAELSEARGEVRSAREKLRGQLDEVKADNTTLRRTLGQTRQQLKQAQDVATKADDALEAVRREGGVAQRAAEAEARRLRQRVEQLESQTTSIRRAARDDRDAETMRLRLLLDTVMDGAAGLRRELALPPVDMLPADTVRAIVPDADTGLGVGRSLADDDPGLLRQLLDLPRLHLIVDGYNVSKSAWPSSPLEQQRTRLSSRISALVAGKGIEVTIVFDGADLTHPPRVSSPRGIRVLFSPPGVIADDTVRLLVSAEPVGRPLVVVSTDREVAESVTKMGARSVSSQALIAAVGV
ncbi:MAG: NYN domain-containing protein [Propionibacteriales bacterium]|nr:NYN domain-containing protein [Propionibacteriales bacterium]